MTDPTDDELTEALRRDLRSSHVPYDERRADEMIGRATEVQLLDARHWNAPLAAAAAVVLVGGGAAIVAANVGHGHHQATPTGGGFAVCGSASPVPAATSATPSTVPSSAEPSASPSAEPTAPSSAEPTASSTAERTASSTAEPTASSTVSAPPRRSTSSAVPGVQLPSSVPGVRVSAAPTNVFPVVVSPTIAAPSASPVPSVAPTPVARPVPSASDPVTPEPCASSTAPVPPATSSASSAAPASSTPSAAPSVSTSGARPTLSGSTSPAYEPPIPPVPTKSGETNAVPVTIEVTADPGGTAGMDGRLIGPDEKFVVTSVIFRNTVPASVGTLTLTRGGKSVLHEQLTNFRALDMRLFDEPLTFTSDAPDAAELDCTGPSACDASVVLVGNYVPR
jgi:hypothetical protein